MPARCVEALRGQRLEQQVGSTLDKDNARRAFRSALAQVQGIDRDEWTPRELRHSFVSLLSDSGVPLEEISRLVGHSGASVTELVYRHKIRPVVQTGAVVMDSLFATRNRKGAAPVEGRCRFADQACR